MNRYAFMILLVVGPLRVVAQRLDGCPTPEMPTTVFQIPPYDALEEVLRQLGVSLTVTDLSVEINNSRPDTRSLVALRLAETPTRETLTTLMHAWLTERDRCTEWIMRGAVTSVVRFLSYDPSLHPGRQPWVSPFAPCNPPADPHITLRLEEVNDPGAGGPTIQVMARNRTQETIPFAAGRFPQELFSATVIGPSGEKAEIPIQLERMYRAPRSGDGVFMTHGRTLVTLKVYRGIKPRNRLLARAAQYGHFENLPSRDRSKGAVCSNTLEINVAY